MKIVQLKSFKMPRKTYFFVPNCREVGGAGGGGGFE